MNDDAPDPPAVGAAAHKPLDEPSLLPVEGVAIVSSTAAIVSAAGGADAARLNAGAEKVNTIVRPDGTVEMKVSRSPPRSPLADRKSVV